MHVAKTGQMESELKGRNHLTNPSAPSETQQVKLLSKISAMEVPFSLTLTWAEIGLKFVSLSRISAQVKVTERKGDSHCGDFTLLLGPLLLQSSYCNVII